MNTEIIKVFVGCDPNNCDLEQMMVLEYSIKKHTKSEVDIHWMQLSNDKESFWYTNQESNEGWRTEKWATPFSGFRWAIPELCNFKGRAIYMDADVVILSDIAELWNHPIAEDKIVAAKGGDSTARLCTCVWDCEKAQSFIPPLSELQADPDGHKKLMQKLKSNPNVVQNYLDSYNCIDGENLPIDQIKILHYSDMGTQFSHKYSLKRLEKNGQKHWFDGEISTHPRADLIELFDRYYNEALDAGYKLEDYSIKPFGEFKKSTQIRYKGNKITRPESNNWFTKLVKKFKGQKTQFKLDD